MEAYVLLIKHCVLFVLLIVAAYTDLTRGKVYNWSTMPAVFLGLALAYVLGGVWAGRLLTVSLAGNLLAALLVFAIFIWPYLMGGVGAGDVKLIVAVGAVGGFRNLYVVHALFYSALVGAVFSLIVLLRHGKLREGLKGSVRFLFSLGLRKAPAEGQERPAPLTVPYGAAIAVGSMVAWFTAELQRSFV